jgi:hypothetical protein
MIDAVSVKAKLDDLVKQRDQLIVNLQFVQGAIQFAQLLLDEAAKADAPTPDTPAKMEAP